MFRVLTATALLGSLVLTAGCNRTPANYEVFAEVIGADGAAAKQITIATPGDSAQRPVDTDQLKLPMKLGYVIDHPDTSKGEFVITATPAKGALTCKIIVEKKEVKRVEGKDGETVTCSAKIAQP